MAGWIKMSLGTEVGIRPVDLVLLTHVYCGQTAGWIKMAFGPEVGLDPGHIVLNGDPATLPTKGAQPPPANFRPMSIVPKRSPISATAELLLL